MILSLVIMSLVGGGIVTALGYYTPFMLLSSVLMAVGAGMLSTFKVDSGAGMWIGYQILFGVGVGSGMQQPMIAVQASLSQDDVPIGTAIMMFSQTLGGALFISVAQNVFQNQLVSNIAALGVRGLDPNIVIQTGATQIQSLIPKKFLAVVLTAYNASLTHTYYVSVAMGALSIFGAACMEWNSVKKKKGGMAAGV